MHLWACDWQARSYTGPGLSSKTDIVLDIGNDRSKLKPGKRELLFLFKAMLKHDIVKYFKLYLGYKHTYFRLRWFFTCAWNLCMAEKSYTIAKLLKKSPFQGLLKSSLFFSVLMQEGIRIPRCLCSLFNYLHLITFTNQMCVFFCCLREKALHGVAGGN